MKFGFKRKYTVTFFIFLTLVAISVAFYLIAPNFIDREEKFFLQILIVSLLDSLLITIFILGLYRVNYYLYHDHLEIHRSLRKPINLSYERIEEIIEIPNDKIFLGFGKRPSFKVKYKLRNNKIKNFRIRSSNHELLKLVIENEKQIRIKTNN